MNYFINHPWYNSLNENLNYSKYDFKKYNKEIWEYLNNKKLNILEIWFWHWKFTNFVNEKKIKNYTWIDIDDHFYKSVKNKYPNYKFIIKWFKEFFTKQKINKFDIIFMSHVFEHLDETERKEIITLISDNLVKWWIWINYMPNAQSILEWSKTRYFDIDHKFWYTPNSFNQLLNKYWNFEKITHNNAYIWASTLFWRYIHYLFLFFTKIYFLWMLTQFPNVYTSELITIIKK